MNWKDRPELFANGKFKGKTNFEKSVRIVGAEVFLTMDEEQETPVDEWEFLLDNNKKRPIEDCTLIARKIEDMTDEEKEQIWDTFPDNEYTWEEHRSNYEDFVGSVGAENIEGGVHSQSEVDELIGIIQGFAPAMLEALSIGVYPFEDDTDVIFKSISDE